MGKKKSKKISNKNLHLHHPQEKKPSSQHLGNLIKVLKPKVYITHSSTFKSLVQQLTGNGSPVSSPELPPSPLVIITQNLEGHHHPRYHQEPALDEVSMDNSSEGSVLSSSFGSVLESSVDIIPCMTENFDVLYDDELPLECNNILESSWAFATDFCSYDNYCDVVSRDEGVSVFDYDICCSYDDYQIQY